MKVLCRVGYNLNDECYSAFFTIPLPASMAGEELKDYVKGLLQQHFADLNVDMNLFEDSRKYHYELNAFEILTGSIVEL